MAPETVIGFIDGVFQSAGVEIPDPSVLAEQLVTKEYQAKTPVVQAGQLWGRLLYVEQGLVRLYYSDRDGKEFNKGFFTEGFCLWPVAPRDRYSGVLFHIEAIENSRLLECDMDRLEAYLSACGQWQAFALHYAQGLLESKFQREHDLLTLSATEHYRRLIHTKPEWLKSIPDYHLASYLGVTNVQLSRLKKRAS